MDIKDLAAIVGAVTGPLALVIALMVYFRDRAKVRVTLNWDMETVGNPATRGRKFGVVTIYNIGRRPIYLSHAHVKLPRPLKDGTGTLLLTSGVHGVTLAEGAAPHTVPVEQELMKEYADLWPQIRATVIDAASRSPAGPAISEHRSAA